jgi:predicted DNA-binding protein with PD1-like motif
MVGVGTIFQSEGKPSLHFHAGIGRGDHALVGCPRESAECFLILEVIVIELLGLDASRVHDPQTGFHLLRLLSSAD